MIVDLVNVRTRDGVRLDGIWRQPSQEKNSQLGVDVVILHHGVEGNFYHPGMFEEYSEALLERGCAVLRVNNRGHDPISRAVIGNETKRIGAAYEAIDACQDDWEAWVSFAQEAGYERIGLWGHSLGATKSIYYLAMQHDSRVTCVVAGSPPRFSYSAYTDSTEGVEFKRVAAQAQHYIDAGQPETLIEMTHPLPLLVTAGVFIDKYGPEEKYDILKHIPHVRVPLLIMIGTEEAYTMLAFKGLPAFVEQLAREQKHVTFAFIPGADHAYTHQRNYVWGVVSRWLEKVA